jgi:hypothetical protein
MRRLWEVFTLAVTIAILLAIGKGFPQFGRALAFLILNPVGLLLIIGGITWVALRRRRKALDSPRKTD